MNRWDIINHYLTRFEEPKYLEIGIHEGVNWQRVKSTDKVGVDPFPKFKDNRIQTCTSDAFFDLNEKKFDVIFIDGLHEREQFKRDVKNAISCLNSGGVIVCHDCAPTNEEETLYPRPKPTGRWLGNVYLGWIDLRCEFDYLMYVVEHDEGCGIIEPDKIGVNFPKGTLPKDFNDFLAHRNVWLNLEKKPL